MGLSNQGNRRLGGSGLYLCEVVVKLIIWFWAYWQWLGGCIESIGHPCNTDDCWVLFSYKKHIFLCTLFKGPCCFAFFVKLVPPRACCLLHACHAFCDELVSLLWCYLSDVPLFVRMCLVCRAV